MRWLIGLTVLLAGLLLAPATALADCTCAKSKVVGGWCDDCNMGHVKTVRHNVTGDEIAGSKAEAMKCRDCFEAASSINGGYCATHAIGFVHGEKGSCESCVRAAHGENDGWCDFCKTGFADGRSTKCKNCLAAIKNKDGKWCDDCSIGYADGLDTKCKDCFKVMKADDGGWCEKCAIGYADGHETKCKECFANMQLDHGGWCGKCKTGYAKGAQTWCQSCFEAIQKDARCAKCDVTFKDGDVCRTIEFQVVGLDKDKADKVEDKLKEIPGASDVKVDKDTGNIRLKICESDKANAHDTYVVVRQCGCDVKTTKVG